MIASAGGTLLESLSFDAHGNRRDPTTWQGSAPPPTSTNIGFTGQEHVDSQSFIHFNGRIYDPQLGRMLQADPVQNPGSQGLNRYAYVANNPLTLTDPTGYSFWDWVKVAAAVAITVWTGGLAAEALAAGNFWTGMAIAAAGGFTAGVVTTGTLQGGLIGAFTAAAFYGIGSAFTPKNAPGLYNSEGNITAIGETGKVLAHGMLGGVSAVLSGRKFGNGFLSAGIAEAASGKIAGVDAKNLGVSAERVVAAAIVGGTTSVLTGGKFANGAVTSAMAQAFNDEIHKPVPITQKEQEMLDNKDLAGFWDSRMARGDPWGREGASIWSRGNPNLTDADLLKGDLVLNNLLAALAARDGVWISDVPMTDVPRLREMYSSEVGEIGLGIAQAHAQFVGADGIAPTLLDGAKYHQVVFAGFGLPASTYGGTPLGDGPDWWLRAQAIATNRVFHYCDACAE
ncbi:RHS repeat-associated core domain-containing protein [Rudaea sp.]|uniref:RHS repeat-associated core domain-containing protein n=1 Tax=Rudaea sp. TaxID=2136325 RepID=UPI003784F2DC